MHRYLIKALVLPFYKRHAVFFGVLFFCAFSFLNGRDHLELGKAILASGELLLALGGLFFAWVGYLVFWTAKLLKQPGQRLSPLLLLLTPKIRSLYLVQLSVLLLMPVLVYGAFLLYAGAESGLLIKALYLFIWVLGLSIGFANLLYRLLLKPSEKKQTVRWQFSSWSLLFLRFYWRSNRWGLPLIVGFSILFWTGCLSLSVVQEYDSRFLYLVSLLLAAVYYPLVQGLLNFENQWRWLRQLPVRRIQQIKEEVLLFVILLLPVAIVSLRFPLAEGREGLLLSLSVLFALRGAHYYTKLISPGRIASLFLLYFLMIMYQLPLYGLMLPFVFVGIWGYAKAWYLYEPDVSEE